VDPISHFLCLCGGQTGKRFLNKVEAQALPGLVDSNTPSWGTPSNTSTSSIGGQIAGNAFLGNYTPDPRFFQLALKYFF
jgi:hypothetical protein